MTDVKKPYRTPMERALDAALAVVFCKHPTPIPCTCEWVPMMGRNLGVECVQHPLAQHRVIPGEGG